MRDYAAHGVVTNLSNQAMIVDGDVPGVIPPWKSTIMRGGRIAGAERVSIVDVPDPTNLGGVMFDGWDWFGNRMAEFPRTTPLYISRHDIVGEVTLNPWRFSNHPEPLDETERYDIQLNLWWAPAGRMRASTTRTPSWRYTPKSSVSAAYRSSRTRQEPNCTARFQPRRVTPMIPIVRVTGRRNYIYPWHRGWTDEDCIWMAIELHPKQA